AIATDRDQRSGPRLPSPSIFFWGKSNWELSGRDIELSAQIRAAWGAVHSSCVRGYFSKSPRQTAYQTLYQVRSALSGCVPGMTWTKGPPFWRGWRLSTYTLIVLASPDQRAAYFHLSRPGARAVPPEMSCTRIWISPT